ncbi:ROK family transcriptional regulator [Spirochaeta lutea]|uniref:HTH marR-type domain-containing protein n=1 Tax=Spirochaeta lutea TaxID=1480694 RepID=A0A098QY11_9SPIO|nr:ROK family transcriptional regulator [Spirochaeta lutea]KGE72790.1 hypothetical protein DC28_06035 [Spirochaeta lutea]
MLSTNIIGNINTNRILRSLWEREPISRIDIAKALDLDKSTISKIMSQLIERGIVVEKDVGDASPIGGRKPVFLGVNPEYGAVIGMEFQTTFARIIALDMAGQVIIREEIAINFHDYTLPQLFEELALRYAQRLRKKGWRVIGASLAVAGIVNPIKRAVIRSNPLSITSPVHIGTDIQERLGFPVFLENDAKCCCWADLVNQRGQKVKNFMYILGEIRTLNILDQVHHGLAVGFAFVIDGKVHYGHNFASGEFSSVFKRDSFLSQFSLSSDQDILQIESSPILRKRIFEELAANAALPFNLLNLHAIAIAGDMVAYEKELTPIFEKAIRDNWSYPDQTDIQVSFTPFGPWAVAHGAAALIIEQLFALPKIEDVDGEIRPVGIHLFQMIEEMEAVHGRASIPGVEAGTVHTGLGQNPGR